MPKLIVKERRTDTIELDYVPCLKCGSEDISFWNANESAFNYGGADCKDCGNKVSINSCWTDPQHIALDRWNSENDPVKIRAALMEELSKLKAKIKAVPKRAPRKQKGKSHTQTSTRS